MEKGIAEVETWEEMIKRNLVAILRLLRRVTPQTSHTSDESHLRRVTHQASHTHDS